MKLKKAAVTALAVITLLGAFPVQVFAEEPAEPIAAAEESAAGETAADEVVGSESIAEEPAEQEGSESVAEEPAEQESAAEEPALSESAVEEPAEPTEIEETIILTDAFSTVEEVIPGAASMTDEEAFAGYVASVFYPQEPQLSEAADASYLAGSALTGMDRRIYNVLASRIRQVASGQEASTSFSFTLDSGRCTAATLGLPSLGTFPELSEEAEAALWAQMSFDLSRVLDALLADMPYDLYWYDKTAPTAVSMEEGNSVMDGSEGEEIYSINFPVNYTIEMPVSEAYAGAAEYTTDSTRLASVRTAAANAAAIVQAHSGETDLAKLMRYRDAICDLTDYNQAAAGDSSTPYGDPWQLIYVFDGDPSTTVVCEGYSKAFKYLCDISEFSSPLIYARLATGYMAVGNESGEDHMWNVLAMPDGRNYLVDVTNTDDGIGSDHSLFLNGYESVSADGRTYGFACLAEDDVFYIYDDDTLSTFSASDLQLSAADYDGSAATPINISGSAVVSDIPDRVYDGTEQRPEVTVTYEGETLSAGTDYSVAYQNNVNAGTADVTIVFCGNYSGMIFTHFTITKAVYDMSGVSFTTTYRTYNGAEQNMRVTGTLPAGVTVSYTGNGQTELGRYPVTAHFSGDSANYEPIADMTSTLVIVRDTVEFYGRWGENHDYVVTYSIEDNYRYTLTVSGSGDIPDGQGPKEGIMATVIITDGVTGIGAGNFSQFWNLESITIPESVTRIGDRAFYTDSSLSSITLPENVTQIGKEAFYNCSSLTSFTIPEKVVSIGDWAFYGCSGLTTIVVPEGTQEIGKYCFRNCTGLREITLPGTLTEVREGTFNDCSGLESIVIPEGVTEIGIYAFLRCSSLRSVDIPNSVTSIEDRAFSGCSSLTEVALPESVESIGSGAFAACTGLTSIALPEGIESIKGSTFYGCTSLRTVTIPGTVTDIAATAFEECSSLETVYYTGTEAEWAASGLQESIPDGVAVICSDTVPVVASGTCGENLKWVLRGSGNDLTLTISGTGAMTDWDGSRVPWNSYLSGISAVVIEEGATTIGNEAFKNCTALTSVAIPDSVTHIGDSAFRGCSSLAGITLPESLTYLGDVAFQGCTALTSITLPESITSVGSSTFAGCTGLTSIAVPEGVRTIYELAFSGCTGLCEIILPEGLRTIEYGAFQGCSGLTSITIPKTVTTIRGSQFNGCTGLETIYYTGTEAEWAAAGFQALIPDGVAIICSDSAIPATGILLNATSLDMVYGDRFTLVAAIVPENAADRTVVWTSDYETVAAVEDGVVIARGVGSAVITASVPNSGVSASCTVRVSAKDLTGLAEIADIPELVYNGEAQRPAVSVTYEGEPLRFGDDYTVEYSNNTNAGTAEAVLRFRGNYTGTASAHFTILPAENRWVTPLSCGDVLFGQTPRPSAAAAHGTPVFTYGTSADGPFVSEVPSSVGMYYVRAEVDGGGNYQSLSDVTSFGIQFTDVTDTSAFYYPPVYWAVDGGITTGYSDGTFRPWNTCNRAAVVTFLWRLAGSPAQDTSSVPFRDMTGNSDFDQAIIWAVSKGITTGYSDNTFRPWSTCSRAAIVTFLWRYLGQPAAPAGYRADFTDMTGNSDFDAAIAWAAANGITTGWTEANGTSTFRPWNTCNRASVVTFLWRMANL